MSAVDPCLASAGELRAGYAARALSPVEVTQAVLDRIESLDPVLNAYCLVDAEAALAQARASEARWAAGTPAGPLDGVPVGVKDVFLTGGWPTLRGSRLVSPDQPWQQDSPPVVALREAGAVLVGKTTTPELGWKGVTDSPLHGVTRNPWDPSRTAGGSSGGSSAALVTGMATLALGTDGGGSIRIPGAFCGHPGFKPTYGRVPMWPTSPYGTLAHGGPMARTVADLALLLEVLVRPDPRDWQAVPADGFAPSQDLEAGVAGLRVAFSGDLGFVSVDDEVAALVAAGVEALKELGARVEAVDPGFDDPIWAFETLWNAGAAAATRHIPVADREQMDPGLCRAVEAGETLSALDYLEATRQRAELGVRMGQFHQQWDLFVTPTLPLAAFEVGADVPPGWPNDRWATWAPFSYPFNLTQQPAATVPCGLTTEGLPVGIQIVGARFADSQVLGAARALEAVRPFTARPAMLAELAQGERRD